MVTGLNIFRDYFADDTDKYVLIGGAACDIVFTSNDATFRATKDLDMVLIVEALSPEFGEKFWKFIDEGGYENCNTTSGKPQFFRFTEPKDSYEEDFGDMGLQKVYEKYFTAYTREE